MTRHILRILVIIVHTSPCCAMLSKIIIGSGIVGANAASWHIQSKHDRKNIIKQEAQQLTNTTQKEATNALTSNIVKYTIIPVPEKALNQAVNYLNKHKSTTPTQASEDRKNALNKTIKNDLAGFFTNGGFGFIASSAAFGGVMSKCNLVKKITQASLSGGNPIVTVPIICATAGNIANASISDDRFKSFTYKQRLKTEKWCTKQIHKNADDITRCCVKAIHNTDMRPYTFFFKNINDDQNGMHVGNMYIDQKLFDSTVKLLSDPNSEDNNNISFKKHIRYKKKQPIK